MRIIFGFLAAASGIYSLLIFIRIILSWFGGMAAGKPVEVLNKITDPYLEWWRNKLNLRLGLFDFSVIAAILFLYFIQNIFNMLYTAQRISIGSILALLLGSLWSIVSFFAGFCIIIILLRIIAYLTNRNIYSPFWNAVDSMSKPVIYRINRVIFGAKIVNYLLGMIVPVVLLAAVMIGGSFLVNMLANFLVFLPI